MPPRQKRKPTPGVLWNGSGLTCHQKRLFLRERTSSDTVRLQGVWVSGSELSHRSTSSEDTYPIPSPTGEREPLRLTVPFPAGPPARGSSASLCDRTGQNRTERGGVHGDTPVCCATERAGGGRAKRRRKGPAPEAPKCQHQVQCLSETVTPIGPGVDIYKSRWSCLTAQAGPNIRHS